MDINWKYYIPHDWEGNKNIWEDVWLLPDKPDYKGESLWLTVDAVGNPSDPSIDDEEREFRQESLKKMGDNDYYCDDKQMNMVVRAVDFTKEELLNWVKVWLKYKGLPCNELIEGTLEDFKDTNDQARAIYNIMKDLEDGHHDVHLI